MSYADLGRLQANTIEAQLQLEQIKRQRDAENAAALNQALSSLVGGVAGGFQMYQGEQDKQAQLAMENTRIANEKAAQDAAIANQKAQLALSQAAGSREAEAFSRQKLSQDLPGIVQSAPATGASQGLSGWDLSSGQLDQQMGATQSGDAVRAARAASGASLVQDVQSQAAQLDKAADTHISMVGRDAALPAISDWHQKAAEQLAATYGLPVDEAKNMLMRASYQNQMDAAAKLRQQDLENQDLSVKKGNLTSEDIYRKGMVGAEQTKAEAEQTRANAELLRASQDKSEAIAAKKQAALDAADARERASITTRVDTIDRILSDPKTDPDAQSTKDLISEKANRLKRLDELDRGQAAQPAQSPPGQAPSPSAAPAGGQMMIRPDGARVLVPAANVQAAAAAGYKLAQ